MSKTSDNKEKIGGEMGKIMSDTQWPPIGVKIKHFTLKDIENACMNDEQREIVNQFKQTIKQEQQ